MSNSSLSTLTVWSPNHSGTRTQPITKIAIHHTAGVINAYNLGQIFVPVSRQASSNYGIGHDGQIALYVDEANRAWTTASAWCDNRAVTIEVSNSVYGGQWLVSDYVLERTIQLCTDICYRNNIYPCTYTGDTSGTLQKHEWYALTNCPGPYLGSKFSYIAKEVTARLDKLKGNTSSSNSSTSTGSSSSSTSKTESATSVLYRVRKTWKDSKSQIGAYKDLSNAKAAVDKNKGYYVFDNNGKSVYPTTSSSSSSSSSSTTSTSYIVKVTVDALNIRSTPSTSGSITGVITDKGSYTIVQESTGTGATKWGKLKSGRGWISLDFTDKVSTSTTTTAKPSIVKGSIVNIIGNTYSTGETIPTWVKQSTHVVSDISGNKALLGYPNGICSWVPLSGIKLA